MKKARGMTTRLTLTIDNQVIQSAKEYARDNGKSLSNLVENYLKAVSSKEEAPEKLTPRIAKLMGSVKLPENFDCKNELGNALLKKYSK